MKTRFMRDMFRNLSDAEHNSFRQWADDNYVPGTEINPVWHPAVQDRCRELNNPAKISPLTDAQRAHLDDIRDNCQTCGLPFEGRWKLCTDLECRSYAS